MPEVPPADIFSEGLPKSQLAGDLLDAMRTRAAPDAEQIASRGFRSDGRLSVIIEGNGRLPGGASQARALIARQYAIERQVPEDDPIWAMVKLQLDAFALEGVRYPAETVFQPGDVLDLRNSMWTDQYLFGCLDPATVSRLTEANFTYDAKRRPLVHKIWLNHAVGRFVFESGRTVKCDAARAAFSAAGEGIVWAVADTGIDGTHFHFRKARTLVLPNGLQHMDFTPSGDPLRDDDGHGTHVAGIIAGEAICCPAAAPDPDSPDNIVVQRKVRNSDTEIGEVEDATRSAISGIAPLCKLVSLKVLDQGNNGDVGLLLAALGYIQKVNDNGRNLRIHGVNLSLGYTFDARWFAAGQSPLCQEVDRLVRSGVVVVVAAGNSGYGTVQSLDRTTERAAHLATISDPGNADLAITVGSTHRESPHTFGISYFSAKGPTADGRMKPDLVAPGERIVSALPSDPARPGVALYHEDTGTSMAAPHVSGAIAAFLSARREFRGQPERVKRIFMDSATDLRRRAEFQGAGLVDTMRALQSV